MSSANSSVNSNTVSSFFPDTTINDFLTGKQNRHEIAYWLYQHISGYKVEVKEYCVKKGLSAIVNLFIEHSLNTLLKPLHDELKLNDDLVFPNYQFTKINFSTEEQEQINLIFQKIAMDLFKALNQEKKKRSKTDCKHPLTANEISGKLFFKKFFYTPTRKTARLIIHENENNKNTGQKPYGIYAC